MRYKTENRQHYWADLTWYSNKQSEEKQKFNEEHLTPAQLKEEYDREWGIKSKKEQMIVKETTKKEDKEFYQKIKKYPNVVKKLMSKAHEFKKSRKKANNELQLLVMKQQVDNDPLRKYFKHNSEFLMYSNFQVVLLYIGKFLQTMGKGFLKIIDILNPFNLIWNVINFLVDFYYLPLIFHLRKQMRKDMIKNLSSIKPEEVMLYKETDGWAFYEYNNILERYWDDLAELKIKYAEWLVQPDDDYIFDASLYLATK
jgi:hypothetical protein